MTYSENKKRWIIFQSLLVGLPFVISSVIRLTVMKQFSLLILDFSSISFSLALLSFILAKNIYKYENPIPNQTQDEEIQERIEWDGAFCWIFSVVFLGLFIALEIYQTIIMTNGNKEMKPLWIFRFFILLNLISLTVFMMFSARIRDYYRLKISL